MKKSKYGLFGALLIISLMLGTTTSVRGTTYTCAGVVGAQATWRVKTVHEGALTDIFGASPFWEAAIEGSFGSNSTEVGAHMKTVVTMVNASEIINTIPWIYGPAEFCIIYADLWVWTTKPFAAEPDANDTMQPIWLHPENLTLWCQFISGGLRNVSQVYGYPFLNALPVPAATYLSELVWDNDYTISGTTVTHHVLAGYIGLAAIYGDNCTESWRYSNSYGTFLGYRLVHKNGTIAYETELVVPGEIPSFELTIVLGVSMGTIIGLIYVAMKKKR